MGSQILFQLHMPSEDTCDVIEVSAKKASGKALSPIFLSSSHDVCFNRFLSVFCVFLSLTDRNFVARLAHLQRHTLR